MKATRFIGVIVFLAMTCWIAGASITYARSYGYDSFSLPTFSMGTVELRNTQEFDSSDIENIEIEYSSENIRFYSSGSDKIVIKEYLRDNPGREETQMIKKDDTLTIESDSWAVTNVFVIGVQNERIEVYLPDTYRGSLKVTTTSGDIKSEADWELKSLETATSSGNSDWMSVKAEEIKAEASSGHIRFEYAEGNRDFSASSGKITIDGGEGATNVSTTSGAIRVEDAQGSFCGSASSGNIRARFIMADGDIDITTTSGDIDLMIPEDSSFTYEGEATSGGIDTDFDEVLSYNKRGNHAEGTYKGGGISINTEASSGNTEVDFD